MQPASPRVVRPLRRARILVRTVTDVDIVPAVRGLLPTRATTPERRAAAAHHRRLNAELMPGSVAAAGTSNLTQPKTGSG